MIGVLEDIYRVIIIDNLVGGLPMTDVLRDLSDLGYEMVLKEDLQDVEQELQATGADVIICPDTPQNLRWLSTLGPSTLQKNHAPPLICVLTDAQAPPPELTFVDLVMPFIPAPFLDRTLRNHLQIREQLLRVRHDQDEVNLLKNAIVRNVSHELKTPLLQVKSAVALIAEEERQDNLAEMAVQATARLETVVKNITLLADSMNGNFGPLIIQESLDHALRNLRRIWVRKEGVSRIVLDIDDNLPPVMGNNQGLGIVLQQLLDNALKFSKDEVFVHIYEQQGRVFVDVQDSGIGIAPDQIKQIFESFYQVDSSTTRRYGGTGVGLAIVRLIMDKHETEIFVESQPDTGSCFSFSLPALSME